MKVSYEEDLANHFGLQRRGVLGNRSVVSVRAKGNAGQVLSSEITTSACRSCPDLEKATSQLPDKNKVSSTVFRFHPLDGVRRWGSNLSNSREGHVLSVWTEAYEIPNGLNVLAAKRGRDKASEMWNAYLKRVAELGKEQCGGTISQGQTIDEFTDKLTNPFAK